MTVPIESKVASTPTTKEIYATLAGNVDTKMVQSIFQAFPMAIKEGVQTVHLLLHSGGGMIGDGIGIYNYLRNLPINIIAYNGGMVSSIAVLIFLAAKVRKASHTATFLIHKSHYTAITPTRADSMSGVINMLAVDDARTEEILKSHIKLPDEKWAIHEKADLTITAKEALSYGLIHEIADFQVPAGEQLYNLHMG